MSLFKKFFGSRNDRLIRDAMRAVDAANRLEPQYKALTPEGIAEKTKAFRARLADGETVDALLPEAFALVREASQRALGLRHYDVQLIGGWVLHQGKIAEMRTGEGKTLMATLAVYLNALSGRGVHVVTINDYLVQRDAAWMRPVYELLGLTVGVNIPSMSRAQKQAAYAADITYVTNNELGFDYLRDNMVFSVEERVQRELHFAIVDEVDSILIDEARTPLIISGMAEGSTDWYVRLMRIMPKLKLQESDDKPGDYTIDEKVKQAHLTEQGHDTLEALLREEGLLSGKETLYDPSHLGLVHHVSASLRAHALYRLDVDYIVRDDQIWIVDEHTGRVLAGRRWSDGLHQAIEAKEGVTIQQENQTLASITFQNYFRLYQKLSGMTGTADTEAYEFQQIYGLEVVVIPTNQAMIRKDHPDVIFLNKPGKYQAIIEEIKDCHKRGQPVLVGTASIENSEYLSAWLHREKIPHHVLNAKQHDREALIVAEAGRPHAVTIATNMAGRGTDIVLGGNPDLEIAALGEQPDAEKVAAIRDAWRKRHDQVLSAGGLHVLGTERHEARRIDNQLRGRSGRQGDPGSSRFYLSLEDNLMRIFGSERLSGVMQRLGMKENEPIVHSWITRAIENAQRKVEGHHFDVRKQLLEYDDVANEQRKVIYEQRYALLASNDVQDVIKNLQDDVVDSMVQTYMPDDSFIEEWDLPGFEQAWLTYARFPLPIASWVHDEALDQKQLHQRIVGALMDRHHAQEIKLGEPFMRHIEKSILLQSLDMHWKDHLSSMDHLRQGIHLRGYAQKNPKQEYKREAFALFSSMLDGLKHHAVMALVTMEVADQDSVMEKEAAQKAQSEKSLHYQHAHWDAVNDAVNEAPTAQPMPRVGRNDVCPCGSGKKYKHCHGQI